MKVGLFFGSFNPVHVGHMVIANYMAEFTDLDKIWFVVSPHNPFKKKSTLLHDHHRLELVRLAIGDSIKLQASDIEFKLPQPSYTINTLAYLLDKYPKNEFSLIMGSDNLEGLHKWKNAEDILKNHNIYVYPRPASDGGALKLHSNVKWTEAPLMELSSTFLREAIKNKRDVQHMIPFQAYEYIKEMHFYKK